MPKQKSKRDNGTGYIYKRGNLWLGRLADGVKADGSRNLIYFSGKTEAEVKRKILEYHRSGPRTPASQITTGDYITRWLKTFKASTLKTTSYDRLENTIRHQILPNIGDIPLQQLSSDDIQNLLMQLKSKGLSYSSIKKTHDCLGAVLKHAVAGDDIAKNPMLRVVMPEKNQFKTKEIRFFTESEAALITEEAQKAYSTGKLKYGYGDVYILMLNTGIRMGEVIALEKADVDFEKGTIHIRRTAQRIMRRDAQGNRIKGMDMQYSWQSPKFCVNFK